MKHTTCAICNGGLIEMVQFDETPPANKLYNTKEEQRTTYPLNLVRCLDCYHMQLDFEIPKEELFVDYPYTSAVSSKHLKQFATELTDEFEPKRVLDIGSNDGTTLSFFKALGAEVLGFEPAKNIAEKATVPTATAFFNTNTSKDIGKFDLIVSQNMMAHNRDLSEVVKGIKRTLSQYGTFVFEVSYGMSMLENLLFDLIYHEHYHYWTALSAVHYFTRFGLMPYKAKLLPDIHGGSIRFYLCHTEANRREGNIQDIMQRETEKLFPYFMNRFIFEVPEIKENMKKFLASLMVPISMYGYPAKACTTSYYFGLDKDTINNVYDDNPLKIGKFTHLGHEIKPATQLPKNDNGFLFLSSWNYYDQLKDKLKDHKLLTIKSMMRQ